MRRVTFSVLVLALAAASPAMAQDRAFVRAMVGATMGAGPGAVFGGTVGVKIAPTMQIFGEFGKMQNVLPNSVEDEIGVEAAYIANAEGGKHSSEASASAGYGLIGLRSNFMKIAGSQTFLEVGGGAAHVESDVHAVIRGSASLQGDISDLVSVPFTEATPETKGMFMIGMGATLGVTRTTAVEFGVRYFHIATSGESINSGKVYGGFRVGF